MVICPPGAAFLSLREEGKKHTKKKHAARRKDSICDARHKEEGRGGEGGTMVMSPHNVGMRSLMTDWWGLLGWWM